jgi:uncharacterized membrane protein
MAPKDNLGTPRGTPISSGYDSDAFARWAESIARFLGTGRYLAGQTIFVMIWIALNGLGIINRWDPYPFILLNLCFSTQAAYAAPLILLAQNRQAERDRLRAEEDRIVNQRTVAEAEFLARELADIRLVLEQKANRDDLIEPIARLAQTLERIHGVSLTDEDDSTGYSADSSHQ